MNFIEQIKFDGKTRLNNTIGKLENMSKKDGRYYIRGRLSDVVIGENGENINPDTVEQKFIIDNAKMLSVLGLKGDDGEELSIVIQINPYLSKEKLDGIINEVYAINETLPKTSAVRKFYFTYEDIAPPTAIKVGRKQLSGKIESGEVKLISFSDIKAIAKEQEETDSPLMLQIKEIVAKILDIDVTEVKGSSHIFYDLSATSIQYFSILTSLSEEFSIDSYNDSEKYRYTVKEICEYIERHL